jgi:hypothetical protein
MTNSFDPHPHPHPLGAPPYVPPHASYVQPPLPQPWAHPQASYYYAPRPQGVTRGALMRWAGGAVGLAIVLFFAGMIILGIGSSKRRYKEARAFGAFTMLVSVVPGLVGGGLFVAGALKER